MLLMFSSCHRHLSIPVDYVLKQGAIKEEIHKPVMVGRDSLKSYATSVTTYGKYFSGITYFKNIEDSSLRVLFTTYTGLKLFDIEIVKNTCRTKYVMEQLNNPVVLNLLCHDFKLISGIDKQIEVSGKYEGTAGTVFVSQGEKDVYYFKEKDKMEVYKIVETVANRKKIQTVSSTIEKDSMLLVKHYNFNFRMTFKKIDLN